MIENEVFDRMRSDWNDRAKEDASYYVAFGRRDQSSEEFFATGDEVVKGIEWEMKRLPAASAASRRGLEIGCGPGRLLRPLSRLFGEIHGVDVADEMIARAKENLHGIPHAHAHVTNGASLAAFADSSFDVVYSYAVFQHIPSREVVLEYLRETHRVLKTGGILRAQINGLPQTFPRYDTWSGVRFTKEDLMDFARDRNFQVLSFEGVSTQYMWTTWRKRESGFSPPAPENPGATIRRVTNADSSEPVAPNRGRHAAVSIWISNLHPEYGLDGLQAIIGGQEGTVTYIGAADHAGLRQVNVILPNLNQTGLVPVQLFWKSRPACEKGTLRVIPAGPQVVRLLSVSDGINLLSATTIETRCVKVSMEEVEHPEQFSAAVGHIPVEHWESFCTDPQTQRYEVNFDLPEAVGSGEHQLHLRMGRRNFPAIAIRVGAAS